MRKRRGDHAMFGGDEQQFNFKKNIDLGDGKIVVTPVDPIQRIPNVAIDPEYLVNRSLDKFNRFTIDRMNWIQRLEEFYIGFDDYLYPVRKGLWDGSSNLHLPMTEIQLNNMHARFMQAFFFTYPWFFVDPQEEVDEARIDKIDKFMKYILMRYANFNKGIYNAIDDWSWDLVSLGVGILSRSWATQQRKAVVVEENREFMDLRADLHKMLEDTEEKDFNLLAKDILKKPYIEKSIIRTVFNGPVVIAEDPLYILFKGDVIDSTDLNQHDTVMKVCYLSGDQIERYAQSEFFDKDIARSVLEYQPDSKGKSTGSLNTGMVEQIKDLQSGVNTYNSQTSIGSDTYEFLVVYDNVPLKQGSRLNDKIIQFIHTGSKQLVRWNYLDRESSDGKIPLHMAHLYRRPRRAYGRGMVETQFALNETMDILVNQSIDAGTIANQPIFGYKGNSTFDPQQVKIEPGLGIKCDDPNTDIRFFNWNVNPNWSLGVQSLLQSFSSQLTSLGPTSSGQVGQHVGPLRSTSGVNRLAAEADTNLDVLIKRAKSCISELYEGLYYDCIGKMQDKLKISVIGEDGDPVRDQNGKPIFETFSIDEIKSRVHFGIYANSQNMNREAQKQTTQLMAQFLLQPIGIQTGIVQPKNVYEIYKDILKTFGKNQVYKYLSPPQDQVAIPFAAELLMVVQGQKPHIVLNDPEHQQKIEKYQELLGSEQAQLEVEYGYVNPKAIDVAKWALGEHERLLAVVNKPSNMQNPTGEQMSPTLGNSQNTPEQLSMGENQNIQSAQMDFIDLLK